MCSTRKREDDAVEHTMRKMFRELGSVLKREKGAVEHTMNPAYIRNSLNKKGC